MRVPERACGAAGSRQSAGGFTPVKRFCALFETAVNHRVPVRPRPPLLTVQNQRAGLSTLSPSTRTLPPASCAEPQRPLAPLHERTAGWAAPDSLSCRITACRLIDSDLCEQGGYVAMPELAWGQQDRASPGSNFKRIHIVFRRSLR